MAERPASIGFRAKTGRAIAVVLTRRKSEPEYLARWEISLCDPRVPETGQPHHQFMELSWTEALEALRPLEARIGAIALESLSGLVTKLRSMDYRIKSVGIVGSPDRNLEKIGNRHIRAHAGEGILFRHVLEIAAAHHKLRWRSFSDRNFETAVTSQLNRSSGEIKQRLNAIGRAAGKPWRADERHAAMAAWLAL